MTDMTPAFARIEYIAPEALVPYERNARKHPQKQIRQIAASIRAFGFNAPVLINGCNVLLAGHGRVEAAKRLGLEVVPCLRLEHMSEAQQRAFLLADNRIAEGATWDEVLLAGELEALLKLPDLSFDIGAIGFSIAEVDALIDGGAPEEPDNPTDDVLPDVAPSRCHPGDVWQLGMHRLICGDARDADVIAMLMEGVQARMVFTDPPYNVRIDGHVGNSGRTRHREFVMASGEMTSGAFTEFLAEAFGNMVAHSLDGAIHLICMDWRHQREILLAGDRAYSGLKNLIVWVKDNGGMGTFYRSRHELIFAFKCGTAPHVNNFELGQHGRYRTNVWNYRGVNTLKAGRMEELARHPTVKPVQMIADALKDLSGRGEIVLDVFAGSGSTVIAAEKTGRVARLCEIDPIYCDRILARWEAYAKDEATQLVCGWPRQAGRELSSGCQE